MPSPRAAATIVVLTCASACARTGFGLSGDSQQSTTTDSDPIPEPCTSPPPFALVQSVPGTLLSMVQVPDASQSQSILQTAGNLLVAVVYAGQRAGGEVGTALPNTYFAVRDTLGDAFDAGPLVAGPTHDASVQIFYAANIAGGANTVTATQTGQYATSWTGLLVLEYSGVDTVSPVDLASVARSPASPSSLIQAGTLTARSCDLVVAAFADGGTTEQPLTAATGWKLQASDTWCPAGVTDNVASGSSPDATAAATLLETQTTSTSWVGTQVAFRAAGTPRPASATKASLQLSASPIRTWQCTRFTVTLTDDAGTVATTPISRAVTVPAGLVSAFADADCRYPLLAGAIGAGSASMTAYALAADTATNATFSVDVAGGLTASTIFSVNDRDPHTWVGNCSGAFTDGACWHGGVAPGASDVAHFDSLCTTACDAIADTAEISRIWMHSGFNHAITHSSGPLAIAESLIIESGTFTNSATGLTVGRVIDVSGGVFTSSAASLTAGGIVGPINAPTTTLNIALASTIAAETYAQPIVMNISGALGGLAIVAGGNNDQLDVVNLQSAQPVGGALSIAGNNAARVLGTGVFDVTGSVSLTGLVYADLDLLMSGPAAATFAASNVSLGDHPLVFQKSGAAVTLQTDVTAPGGVSVKAGTLNLNGHVLIAGAQGNGTVEVDGTLACSGGCGAGTACNQGPDLVCGGLAGTGTITP